MLLYWLMAMLSKLSKHLSESVSELRIKRELSQNALAKLATLPRSTITLIESGSANPSLDTLAKVASALQCGIDELLQPRRSPVTYIPSESIPCQKHSRSGVCIKRLLPDALPGMDFEEFVFEALSTRRGIPHKEGTKEYTVCTKGEFEIEINGEKYVLGTGDIIAFPGHSRHSYRNLRKTRSHFLSLLVYAPQNL